MSERPFSPEVFVESVWDIRVRDWEWRNSGRLDAEIVVSFGDVEVVLYLSETGDGDVELITTEVKE